MMKRIDSYADQRGYVTGMARDICNYNEVGAIGINLFFPILTIRGYKCAVR